MLLFISLNGTINLLFENENYQFKLLLLSLISNLLQK